MMQSHKKLKQQQQQQQQQQALAPPQGWALIGAYYPREAWSFGVLDTERQAHELALYFVINEVYENKIPNDEVTQSGMGYVSDMKRLTFDMDGHDKYDPMGFRAYKVPSAFDTRAKVEERKRYTREECTKREDGLRLFELAEDVVSSGYDPRSHWIPEEERADHAANLSPVVNYYPLDTPRTVAGWLVVVVSYCTKSDVRAVFADVKDAREYATYLLLEVVYNHEYLDLEDGDDELREDIIRMQPDYDITDILACVQVIPLTANDGVAQRDILDYKRKCMTTSQGCVLVDQVEREILDNIETDDD